MFFLPFGVDVVVSLVAVGETIRDERAERCCSSMLLKKAQIC
jgi:hypothetical protein